MFLSQLVHPSTLSVYPSIYLSLFVNLSIFNGAQLGPPKSNGIETAHLGSGSALEKDCRSEDVVSVTLGSVFTMLAPVRVQSPSKCVFLSKERCDCEGRFLAPARLPSPAMQWVPLRTRTCRAATTTHDFFIEATPSPPLSPSSFLSFLHLLASVCFVYVCACMNGFTAEFFG